jgi:sigma-B regulation protein RsbU (phosphoserine phosphatase)
MYGTLGADGVLTYCNAGHNPPLVISRGAGGPPVVRRLECGGPIVGLFEAATYEQETFALVPGDWLIVFSDGVSEAMSAIGDEYGEERIVECVEKSMALEPRQLLEAMFADVRDFTRGAAQSDDITAMVLRYGG